MGSSDRRKYTMKQVEACDQYNKNDNLFVFEEKVYNAKKFAHPGGDVFMSVCGSDVTDMFQENGSHYGRRYMLFALLAKCEVGDLIEETPAKMTELDAEKDSHAKAEHKSSPVSAKL